MKIELAHVNDAVTLADIHGQAFESGWPMADFRTHIEGEPDDVLIARQQVIEGLVVLRTLGPDSEILTIAVCVERRNQGLGRALVKAAIDRAISRGSETMFLEVSADNPKAICLYESEGFHRFGTRPGYYRRRGGRVDAYLFQKRLG